MHSRRSILLCASYIAAWSGRAHATPSYFLIPYVYDVELELMYNADILSGIADTYLQGSLRASHAHNSTMRFELVTLPKLGTIGWNNSLAGKFVYSPVDVTWRNITDSFMYRAVNEFGESNWAKVSIEFKHHNTSDGVLKLVVCIAGLSVFFSVCGLLRVVTLQSILNPHRSYNNSVCNFLAGLCEPAPDPSDIVVGKTAADYAIDWTADDDDETSAMNNPLAQPIEESFIDQTDEFT